MAAALLGLSVPDFWLGLMMVLVFGVQLGLFPTGGFVPFQESAIGWARYDRAAGPDARPRAGRLHRPDGAGLHARRAQSGFHPHGRCQGPVAHRHRLRHGLPNALFPILTVSGIVAGALLGGTVIIEQVFSLPGIGRLIIGAVLSRDFPVIQGGLLFLAVIYLTVNLIVDVLYAFIDPRVRLQ